MAELRCPECGQGFQFEGANPHYNRARHVESAHLGGGHWTFDRSTAPWYYTQERGWKESSAGVGTSPREDINESARFNAKHKAFFQEEGEELIRRSKGQQGTQHRIFNRPRHADTRTTDEKLQAMADPKSGASEGERRNAEHLLFKRRQAREAKA